MTARAAPEPGRRLLLVELNEFDRDLLTRAADELSLDNIGRLLAMHETVTESPDSLENGRLEPWVQWVSVHTGRPALEHGIRHLGDVPELDAPQLWERLDERGVTSGVWGAMNASRRGANGCLFFLPDPWTFSEEAHPAELDRVLALPRYMARNYLHFSKLRLAREAVRFGLPLLTPALAWHALAELPRAARAAIGHRGAAFGPYCLAEYLSTRLFLEYRRRYDPRLSILFLNSVAHLQHYYWRDSALQTNEPMRYGLRYVDLALGAIFDALGPNDTLLVANALSQLVIPDAETVVLYRQRDHEDLLARAGIDPVRVEALMTNDAHLYFASADACRRARAILEEATVAGERAFDVEAYPDRPEHLFYQLDFVGEVEASTRLSIAGRELPFLEHFERIVDATGRHAPLGTVFASEPALPAHMWNHELFHHVVAFFEEAQDRAEDAPLAQAADGIT